MRTAILGAGFALLVGLLSAGCTESHADGPPAVDSETHFLTLCDKRCEDGLTCVCGVCTRECAAASDCEELSAGASCRAPHVGDKRACGRALPATVCEAECSDDDDCAALSADHRCDHGVCRAGLLASGACPARAAPACDDGEHLSTESDEDGCANPICVPDDVCTLPFETNPGCNGAMPAYTFVAQRGRCELVSLDLCDATANNFTSAQGCWDTCEQDNAGASCLEVWEPVGPGDTFLGLDVGQALARIEGAHRAAMLLPDGSRIPLQLTLSAAIAYRVRTADNPNYALGNVPPPCRDSLQVEAAATFETGDGSFSESWPRLRFELAADGRARASVHVKRPASPANDSENAPLRGSYVPELEPDTCDLFMSIAISIGPETFSGEIGFLIANAACEDVVGTTGVGQGGPPGPTWLAIDSAGTACEQSPCCELLAIDDCDLADQCRLLEGRSVNDGGAENLCLEPRPAGCVARDQGCSGAETVARDPAGQCWLFNEGCYPASFMELVGNDPDCNVEIDSRVPACP